MTAEPMTTDDLERLRHNAEKYRTCRALAERDALAAKLDAVREIEPTLRRFFGDGTRSEIELVDAVDELIGRALDATPETTRPPAQPVRGEPETPEGSTDRGTGVPEAQKPAQKAETIRSVYYREAAASLRAVGHTAAADLLDSTARDLDDPEGATNG